MKHFSVSPLLLKIQQPRAAELNLCEPPIKGYHEEFVRVDAVNKKWLAITFRRLFHALDSISF